jgi:uncharacterized protein
MTTLIVLGASARAAAHSAIRSGLAPYAIDLFADQDLAAVCPVVKIDRYPHGFLRALAAAPAAPWLYTGGLENHPRLVDRLAQIRPLAGNGAAILKRVRDPQQFAIAAEAAGCPRTAMGQGKKLLVKPRRGSGGLTIRFATPQEVVHPPKDCYLQQFIEGESASAVYVAAQGKAVLLAATRQLLGTDFQLSRPFLYVGSLGPLPLARAEQETLVRLGNILAGQFSLVGLFNVDFVRARGQIWPVEVNPRYSASVEVIERATGMPSLRLHLDACVNGNLPVLMPSADSYCGKAVVYAEADFIVPSALANLISDWNQPGKPPLVADLPRTAEPLLRDQPVLTVFAEGPTLADAEAQLRTRVEAVKKLLRT